MTRRFKVGLAVAAFACGLLLGSVQNARASGFQLIEQSGAGVGNAFAGGAALAEDASTVFFNPAGMTQLPGRKVAASLDMIGLTTKFNDLGSKPPSSPTGVPFPYQLGGNGGQAGGWFPIPSGYISAQLSNRIWAGVGVSVPFGLTTDWEPDWAGRFHAVKSDVKTLNINPSLAVKLSEKLSVGAGANYQRITGTFSRNAPYGVVTLSRVLGGNPLGCATPTALALGGCSAEGLSSFSGDDWSWGWNVGVLATPSKSTRLGASYRAAIKHHLVGDVTFGDRPNYALLGPAGAPLVAALADGPISADIELPATISVAGAHQVSPKVQLLADWTWTGWHTVEVLTVVRDSGVDLSSEPLNFEDSWRAGVGVNIQASEPLKVRLGIAYDKTPVQDAERTPRLPDNDRTWVAAGVQYRLAEKAHVELGYAHLFVSNAPLDRANMATPTSTPVGNLLGTAKNAVNLLSVQLSFGF